MNKRPTLTIPRLVSERTINVRMKVQTIEVISLEQVTETFSEDFEPCSMFIKKVEQVSELLGISEEEAERLVLRSAA